MQITGDEHYIYSTYSHPFYTLIVVQNGNGELIEFQIEQHYE